MITFFSIEKRFDPGFVMVFVVDARQKVAEYYIRNDDNTITERRELPEHRDAHLFRQSGLELIKECYAQMETMAECEQYARGWREPLPAPKE